MKVYKRWGNFPAPEAIDDAVNWMLSKPVKDWPLAYQVVKFGIGRSVVSLESRYQWLRR